MADIRYRQATPDDVPRFVGLPQPGEGGGSPRMLGYLLGEQNPQKALMPRVLWIAESSDDFTPIGYIAGHLTERYECDGELQWVYVVAEYRRRGVASELLGHLARWFSAQSAHRVCVDVGNEGAGQFYRAVGATDLNEHWMVWDDITRLPETGNFPQS
jgi:GNAT superfamily N-acetyltransferase